MTNSLINLNAFITIDIETSGLSPQRGGRIIEVGAAKVVDNKIVGKYSQLINPNQKLYKKTIELTGITNEMVENMPTYHNVLPKLHEMIKDNVLIMHNKNFDWDRFLKPYFLKLGIIPQNQVIDTLKLSKILYPQEKKHSLDVICQRLDIKNINHHRSLSDAITTAGIFLKFKEKLKSIPESSIGNIINFNNDNNKINFDQIDIFVPHKETEINNKIIIKGVHRWNSGGKNRIYVNMNVGTVFFDTSTRTWENKNVMQEIDFKEIQNRVDDYLKTRPNALKVKK